MINERLANRVHRLPDNILSEEALRLINLGRSILTQSSFIPENQKKAFFTDPLTMEGPIRRISLDAVFNTDYGDLTILYRDEDDNDFPPKNKITSLRLNIHNLFPFYELEARLSSTRSLSSHDYVNGSVVICSPDQKGYSSLETCNQTSVSKIEELLNNRSHLLGVRK